MRRGWRFFYGLSQFTRSHGTYLWFHVSSDRRVAFFFGGGGGDIGSVAVHDGEEVGVQVVHNDVKGIFSFLSWMESASRIRKVILATRNFATTRAYSAASA